MDPRHDEIAREAARLMQLGQAEDIDDAVHRAADILGHSGSSLPGHGRVRKHAQAMAMQAMGDAAYEDLRSSILQIAEQVMTAFEHTMPDAQSLLVGRVAEGHIDAGVTIHVRLYTRHSITEMAAALSSFGYDEPTFTTLDTRYGRMNQMRFTEEGQEVAVTRCLPKMASEADVDLFSGKHVATMTLEALRRWLGQRGA